MKILSLPVIHYAARRFGWPALKRAAYDAKFQCGDWAAAKTENPQVIAAVVRHTKGGRIAVLGCGMNTLGASLPANGYSELIGLDLSGFAIANNRSQNYNNQSFHIADMTNWSDGIFFDCVVFHESIYYLTESQIIETIRHWKTQMNSGGVFVVTIAQAERYSAIGELIHEKYWTMQDEMIGNRRLITFV